MKNKYQIKIKHKKPSLKHERCKSCKIRNAETSYKGFLLCEKCRRKIESAEQFLKEQEKAVKDTVDNKRVRWEECRIPEEITKKGDIEEKIEKNESEGKK